MSRKNFSPSLEVKLNDSVIHFSENKQSIYLEEIKCISPPSINSLSEIQKIEFDKELNNMYHQTKLWILLPKCEELRSLILTSNIENLTRIFRIQIPLNTSPLTKSRNLFYWKVFSKDLLLKCFQKLAPRRQLCQSLGKLAPVSIIF